MLDIPLLKLQYEILNKTIEELSDDSGLPVPALESTIEEEGWTHWWPAEQDEKLRAKTAQDTEEGDEDEILALQTEQYIDRAKRRLAVYSLAKEIYLAQKYVKLESAIINKAHDILENIKDEDSKSVKELSALYKDMTAKSPMNILSALSFGEEEGGVPTVIVRDLSGRK